ncbi:MAG: glycosyltransferase family 39 protein [Anaerolineae bacterium]|nr:glycosyltransferase family 39 protein [Anaerolineae bacterium]
MIRRPVFTRLPVRSNYLQIIAVIGVALLAAALRLGWLGVNSFAFDEARLSLIALKMARGQEFAAIGMPSSTGIPNLPAAAWVFALPYAFSSDPLVPTVFVGLLNVGAVAGIWWLARRAWGPWAGLVAAVFLAASPYGVLYSRNIWSQNLLVPLALAWLSTAYLGATSGKRWPVALHIFVAGAVFQVHFAGAALVLGSLWLIWRHRWYRDLKPLLTGGGLAALMLLPFVIQVLCCSHEVIDQYRDILGNTATIDLKSFDYTLDIGLGREWSFLALGERDTVSNDIPSISAGLLLVLGFVALALILFRRAKNTPTPNNSPARILAEHVLVLLTVSPLLFLRHSTPVNTHYLLAGLPALALIAGASTRLISHRSWPPVMLLIAGITAALWSVQVGRSLDKAGDIETPGGLGTPLAVTRDAARGIPGDAEVLFFTHGDNPDVDGEPAVFSVLWWSRDHRIVQGEAVLILPPHPAYLMATLAPFQAWEEIVDSGLAVDVQTFDRRDGALPFVLTRYDGTQEPEGFIPIDPPIPLADGVQLEGWRARRVGPRLRISTLWRVIEPPEPGEFRQFHHLRTADQLDPGTPPLYGTDVELSSHNWRAGDRLIVMGDFVPDAAGEFWVDVGHYTLPDIRRFARTDQNSNGGEGDSVRLGPFEWDGPQD